MFGLRSIVGSTLRSVAFSLCLICLSVIFPAQTHPSRFRPATPFFCSPLPLLAMSLFVFGPMGADLARRGHSEHYRDLGRQLAEVFDVPFAEYAAPEGRRRAWAEYAPTWAEVTPV